MSIRDRRRALSLSRRALAECAGIDPHVLQQIELGTWEEGEARIRAEVALERLEAGETEVRLSPVKRPETS
ncbi:MAG: transcriptional regulator with XRE-family HTH domain [Myxococcota bacterium]|jgi:transcriptional regulator with XRE-family HTH domain